MNQARRIALIGNGVALDRRKGVIVCFSEKCNPPAVVLQVRFIFRFAGLGGFLQEKPLSIRPAL